jgi:hypothetical protein
MSHDSTPHHHRPNALALALALPEPVVDGINVSGAVLLRISSMTVPACALASCQDQRPEEPGRRGARVWLEREET